MPKIIINGKELEVSPGITILDAALDNNIEIDHNCGGNCACSTCQVIIEEGMENLTPMREDEADLLEDTPGRTPQSRLACQSQVMGDVRAKIPPKSEL
jgi:2Fe-2S ferredoxin